MGLNSNAQPYQPRISSQQQMSSIQTQNALNMNNALNINNNNNNLPNNAAMKSQQLQHQQKAERVPYSYPSYAEAVNKVQQETNNNIKAQQQTLGAPNDVDKTTVLSDDEIGGPNDPVGVKVSKETEEAIQKLNPLSWPCNPSNAKFYVIKSFGEDDVHKSIKYNLWCSTERGNRKLDEAFNESKRINLQHNRALKRMGHDQAEGSMDDEGDVTSPEIDARDTTMGCPVYLFF